MVNSVGNTLFNLRANDDISWEMSLIEEGLVFGKDEIRESVARIIAPVER